MFSKVRLLCSLLTIMFAALVFSPDVAAQSDECTQNEIAYDETVSKTIEGSTAFSRTNSLCFEGKRGDQIMITVHITSTSLPLGTATVVSLSGPRIPGGSLQESSSTGGVMISYVLPADGAYQILVVAIGDEYTYRLNLRNLTEPTPTATPQPTAEANTEVTSCIEGAYILIPGYETRLLISDDFFLQTYCLYGEQGTEYRITATTTSGDLDPTIVIYNTETQEPVAFNDDISSSNTNAQLDFVPEETLIYFVVVSRVDVREGETKGEYRLEIENRTTGEPDTCPEAFMIPENGVTIPRGEEEGFFTYCLDGQSGHIVTLDAAALSGDLNMSLVVTRMNLDNVRWDEGTDSTLRLRARLSHDEPVMLMAVDRTDQGGFTLFLEYD